MISRDHALAERVLALLPINSLEDHLQDEVLAQGELLEFKKKQKIFEAGARDAHTFYLVDGMLELQAASTAPTTVKWNDDGARRALAQLQPRRYTGQALAPVTMFRIERAVLDHILADQQVLIDGGTVEVGALEDDEDTDWMSRLLGSELFTRLPHDNIQRFFALLEPLESAPGDVIVEQGTPGDYLYIVAEGQCAVSRHAPGSEKEIQLAVLREGDTFGEESLISNSPRNASVKMATPGFVMRLPKASFLELVSNPTLTAVPYTEACKAVEAGAVWIDVRFPDEHAAIAIEGSRNLPLNVLRIEAPKLDRETPYIVYCDTGARSSSGAFILARHGLDVSYLAGGLERTPLGDSLAAAEPEPAVEEEEEEDTFAIVKPSESAAEPADAATPDSPAARPATGPAPAAETPPAAPDAALAAARASEEISKLRAEAEAARAERDRIAGKARHAVDTAKELKRRYDELRNALQSEQGKRKSLESDLASARAEADQRLEMERGRLEGDLAKALARIESLEQEREASGGRSEQERAKLATQLEEAQARYQEAAALREESESARVSTEVEYENRLAAATEVMDREKARSEQATGELLEMRERLEELRSSSSEAARDREAQDSAIAKAIDEVEQRLEGERTKVAAERERLAALETEQRDLESKLREERAAIDTLVAAQKSRVDDLDRREMDLEDLRASGTADLDARGEALALAETELAKEKSAWQSRMDEAVAAERERLEEARRTLEEEAAATIEKTAQELAEDSLAEIREEHEDAIAALAQAQERALSDQAAERDGAIAAAAAQHAAAMEAAKASFEKRIAKLRTEARTRLAEQETMLEDERRRLELESVRLREALTEAQRIISDLEAVHGLDAPAPAPAPAEPLELDLDLEIEALKNRAPEPAARPAPEPAPAPKPAASDGPDLSLDMDTLDEPEPKAAPAPPSPESGVPLIEMPEEPLRSLTDTATKARVITPDQLAELRAKMQAKMRSASRPDS